MRLQSACAQGRAAVEQRLAAFVGQPQNPIVRREFSLGGKPPPIPSLPPAGNATALGQQAASQAGADSQAAPIRKLGKVDPTRCDHCGAERHRGLCPMPRVTVPVGVLRDRAPTKRATLPISNNTVTGDSATRVIASPSKEVVRQEMSRINDIGTSRTMPELWDLPNATGVDSYVSPASSAGPALID